MNKTCPCCGTPLHEQASFCPRCATTINERIELVPPKPRPMKALRGCIALLMIAALALGLWLYVRPRTYDAEETAELLYTDSDGTYQVLLGPGSDRFQPIYWMDEPVQRDYDYRIPVRLYVNHTESGVNAKEVFRNKIESAAVEIIQPDDSPHPMICSQPAPHDALPEATMISLLDFWAETGPVDVVWTLHMKNGDTLVLRQHINIYPIETYNYYADETPMDTIEELQALITEIEQTVDQEAIVNIYLPAVTYDGGLVMKNRSVNLYGSIGENGRTTFTGTVQVTSSNSSIYEFYDIDFVGERDSIGISSSSRLHLTGCTVTGWRTGLLGYGTAWINTQETTFVDNEVGLHFNSANRTPSTYHYTGTRFINNGTGVLLESVPSDQALLFDDCLFSKNGTDIDNRCNQPVDISQATFE